MLNVPTQKGNLAPAAEQHLAMLFGQVEPLQPWNKGLPFYLKDAYAFYEAKVLGVPCVFMAPRRAFHEGPGHLVQQRNVVERSAEGALVILLLDGLTQHDRRTLISMSAPFLAPGNQLFAPQLGLDLRERIRAPRPIPGNHLTPSAQLLLLAALLGQDVHGANASQLALRLGRTTMSMLRVFNELEGLELAEIRPVGRERQVVLAHTGRALWEKAHPLMRTPVRRRHQIPFMPGDFPGRRAGETALADYTMISAPQRETWAIDAKAWARLQQVLPDPKTVWGEDFIGLETWTYDPRLLSPTRTVDPLSLYLSLEDPQDERLSMAADQLLDRMAW